MDIRSIATTRNLAPVKKAEKKKENAFSVDEESPSAQPSVAMHSAINIQPFDALFFALEHTNLSEQKTIDRGNDILDQLEQLKVGLINQNLGKESLEKLVVLLDNSHYDNSDPGLKGIMNEIEIRARVELAKLEITRNEK
ncbi:MAG: hypothetical protein NTX76_02845 [Alphaproteobacteria bacterium]|nr:hypothetical protein [Alphaproteobacteria bacterium]